MRRSLALLLVGVGLLLWTQPVQAATPPKILLAYDSQNVSADSEYQIDSLQRLLTSLNLEVHTIAIDQYHAGDLTRYKFQGVITMINWPQTDFKSQTFFKDRQQFTGVKLHIGPKLAADEQADLGLSVKSVYHQQFNLVSDKLQQLLPFSSSLQVVTQAGGQVFGTLKAQTPHNKPQYPYGVINGRVGFLPYYRRSGLSFLVASQMISQLFTGKVQAMPPLLTITDVTPVSDLKKLDQLSEFLYQQGIPFAVSATSVQFNTQLAAFHRYMLVLQHIENRNGIVFLQTPRVYDTSKKTGQQLGRVMYRQLYDLTKNQVFPVGVSTANYWNQDSVYKTQALGFSDHVLLLPNPTDQAQVYAQQSNISGVYKQAYYALNEHSLATVKSGTDLTQEYELKFSAPTAITVALPSTKKGLVGVEKRLKRVRWSWYNPATANLQTKLTLGKQVIAYQSGSYFLNGQHVLVPTLDVQQPKKQQKKSYTAVLNGFFNFQSYVLIIFISGALVILVVFFFIGRRVYRNMFRRK
ncbi:hypothetical protein [Loigolactobacillus jiayinensis]|uniref:DUF2334 domain-containing protein n=1 Tax=Loigolactobacillus jiayinensis TaxID=2486016 RepID=A0ABW1RFS7_9LACO|nr:hypothetical protein [Loigolactobacillus jiayinensis]